VTFPFLVKQRVVIDETGLPTSKIAVAAKASTANLQAWSAGYATPRHDHQPAGCAGASSAPPRRFRHPSDRPPLSADWRTCMKMIDHPDFVPEIARYLSDGFSKLDFIAQTKIIAQAKRTHVWQNTASGRRAIAQARDRYRRNSDKWPEATRTAWALQDPKSADGGQQWSLRVPGEEVSDDGEDGALSASARSLRPGTVALHLSTIGSLLGQLVRPRKLTEQQRRHAVVLDQSMTTDFSSALGTRRRDEMHPPSDPRCPRPRLELHLMAPPPLGNADRARVGHAQ